MAESQTKIDAAAEKAYAEAADKRTSEVSVKAIEKAVDADKTAPVKADAVAKAVAAPAEKAPAKTAPVKAKKVAAKKGLAKKKPVAKKAAPRKITAKKAAPAKKAATVTSHTPITKLKDTIMATAKNAKPADYTAKAKEMAADMQTRAKAAYDKSSEMTQEAVEFQKGNIEALIQSGKIFASGMQDMGRTYVEEAKSAAETVQGDVKKFAAIKSPTELFQLQGEIARRNFDAMVSTTSKNTEAMLKLANEAFAPLSSRMSLAAEKVRKAA